MPKEGSAVSQSDRALNAGGTAGIIEWISRPGMDMDETDTSHPVKYSGTGFLYVKTGRSMTCVPSPEEVSLQIKSQ